MRKQRSLLMRSVGMLSANWLNFFPVKAANTFSTSLLANFIVKVFTGGGSKFKSKGVGIGLAGVCIYWAHPSIFYPGLFSPKHLFLTKKWNETTVWWSLSGSPIFQQGNKPSVTWSESRIGTCREDLNNSKKWSRAENESTHLALQPTQESGL